MYLDIIHHPEIQTSSIDWAQLSRFYLKMESPKHVLNKNRMMDNVQKCNTGISALW
jgi:hypothetical protein